MGDEGKMLKETRWAERDFEQDYKSLLLCSIPSEKPSSQNDI